VGEGGETATPGTVADPRRLVPVLLFVALVLAVVGSLGAPLITSVAQTYDVSLTAAQWTLTLALLTGTVATPVLGRLGSGSYRRPTILATLACVVAGSALTVVPSFPVLLAGRGLQGVGIGLTALTISVARDHLPAPRSASTVALVSVASTVGIGVGYPMAGWLDDLGGVRLAYGAGLAVTVLALLAAVMAIPASPSARRAEVDPVGAGLLGLALVAVVLLVSGTSLGDHHLLVALVLALLGAVLLLAWVVWERRSPAPLVDLKLLRDRPVAAANLAMLVGGAGTYLLLSLVTRYVQTPASVGYGFALSTFEAGLVLVPFSVLGYLAGRTAPRLQSQVTGTVMILVAAAAVATAAGIFAVARDPIWWPLLSMALLGYGAGTLAATMPTIILRTTPMAETASAMSVNQVVRGVGFSTGSALAGLLLARHTVAGSAFPTESGYTTAAWLCVALMVATVVVALALRAPHSDHS
jgi:predicted MFS family arabinose efflux permease